MASSNLQAQQTTTSFFERGSNINVNDSHFVAGNNNTVVTNNLKAVGSSWLEILASHCAHDALVDSKERYDPPHCAPNTREAIQREIIDWINTLSLVGLVLWLNGSAGAGKSAITQTIAERLKNGTTPSASFFFSRISGSPTRVNGDCLLPTIIYQLCQLLPEYRTSVMKKLKKDPNMFELSRSSQMASLFTKPLRRFSFRQMFRDFGRHPIPIVIIIDGLDECRDPEVQCDLLRVFADAAASVRRRPVRILIASRPEAHITRTLDQYARFHDIGLRRINLDEDQDASMDILTLLRQGFQRIHEEHPLRKYLDPSWPTQDNLDFLVSKSSPQMMLASTAMLYVASPKHRPTDRLITVINLLNKPTSSSSDRPLQRLDSLYTFIFGGIEEKSCEIVYAILGILHLSGLKEFHLPPPTPVFIEKALALQPGDVYLHLEPLISVIHLPEAPHQPIRSLHASLFDFLLNPARSNELALNLDYGYAGLVGHFFLQNPRMGLRLLEKNKIQSISFIPKIIQATINSLLNMELPPFYNGLTLYADIIDTNDAAERLEKAQSFIRMVELSLALIVRLEVAKYPFVDNSARDAYMSRTFPLESAKVLKSHFGFLVPFDSPILEIKHALIFSACVAFKQDHQWTLINAFENSDNDRSPLLHLTQAWLSLWSCEKTSPLQILHFTELGQELQMIDWRLQSREMQELVRVLKDQMVHWAGDHTLISAWSNTRVAAFGDQLAQDSRVF